ncbi:hypothetical protein NJT12_00205 [Flavobacterium sp. AC]|uniref:DUF3164 family protein n=1 Tax=Flavobacterium azizsancarii TaxID=2961580 RepID=A0ABT4W5Z5_9FLAO|nr:hypothetical protein [Flavobacterium azizsancarii]MDA6068024.1 hypothetical protein [Flavobacterium azizsancarii]
MNTEKPTINLNDLSPDQVKQLLEQAKKEAKETKAKTAVSRKALDELWSEFVIKNVHKFMPIRELVEENILETFSDFAPLSKLIEECYGIEKLDQDSFTKTLPDGSFSLTIGYNKTDGFNGNEGLGVDKIKQYMDTLKGNGDNDKLVKLAAALDVFLKPNPVTGMLNPRKVKDLSKLRDMYDSELFNEGIEIIEKAAIYTRTSQFVEGWQFLNLPDGRTKKVTFRFSV